MKKFLKDTKLELHNVVWPTRRRAIAYAAIIIIFSIAVGYLLGGFDALFRALLRALLNQ